MLVKPHPTILPPSPARERLDSVFRSLNELDLGSDIYDLGNVRSAIGGYSDVFRARSKRHNKPVAVKCIRMCLIEKDERLVKALEREIRIWSNVVHPNVLPLLGFFFEGLNAIPNLVSEWMEKGTITAYMKKRPFDVGELIHMLSGIASGLCYLHFDKSIIHSDLKGSNILVSDEGLPLLADFGLSISHTSLSLAGTTGHGEKGSARWIAKELFLSDIRHSTETDMWAFGMVICELLTGNPPFSDIPERRVAMVIVGGQLPNIGGLNFDNCENDDTRTLRAVCSIACSCWNEKPFERPSAKDVLKKVNDFKNRPSRPRETPELDGNESDSMSGCVPCCEGDLSITATLSAIRASSPTPNTVSRNLYNPLKSLKNLDLEDDIYGIDTETSNYVGTSRTFRARSRKYATDVAVTYFCEYTPCKLLKRELRIWSELDHSNILPLLGLHFDVPEAMPYIVTVWPENGTLMDYYKTGHISRISEISEMAIGIASGLTYLHTVKRIIHSDINSSSIFVSKDCRPLIGVFELTVPQAHLSLETSLIHESKGNFRWMAKELFARDDARHSEETDIWAFGMVILELLIREIPYAHIPDVIVPLRVAHGELPQRPEFEDTANRRIYETLWLICKDCWSDNPSARPSARDVLRRLWRLNRSVKFVEFPSTLIMQNISHQDDETISISELFKISRGTYLTQTIAIKETRTPILEDDTSGELELALEKEIQNWRSVCDKDPCEDFILQLVGISFHDGYFVMVSEWKDHRDLLTYMTNERNRNAIDHKLIVRRIANGLKILHEHHPSILHGNLRASNIMVNGEGSPLLGGFGIFKIYDVVVDREIAGAHEVSSDSLRWLAPELQSGSQEDEDESDSDESELDKCDYNSEGVENRRSKVALHTTQSDIYSLGMTIFEIMTGEKPFKKEENPTILRLMVRVGDRPKRPKKKSPAVKNGLDDKLWDLIERCWAQEPGDRPDIFQVNKELDEMWPEIKLPVEISQSIAEPPVEISLEASEETKVGAYIEALLEAPEVRLM